LLLLAACTADRPSDARHGARGGLPVGSAPNAGSGAAAATAANPANFEPSGPTCGSTDLQVSRVTPTVMLLVDGSSSMRTEYGNAPASASAASAAAAGAGGRPGSGGNGGSAAPAAKPTRWSAIRDALIMPDVGVVPQLESMIKFGLAVFGTEPKCPIPMGIVDPTLNNFQKIHDGLPMEPPGMTTPTGRALDQIVERLADPSVSADPNDAASPRIIVLATDGDPNDCALEGPMPNYEPSIQAALKAQARSQRMFVISVGQDAAAAHLQELANIGAGMPRTASPGAEVFYPSDPIALASTLQTLIGNVVLCEVALEGTGVKAGSECAGQVALNGVALPCNDPNGWVLVDDKHIRLQGTACDTFKDGGNAMLRARFPCSAIIPD
jgi:Mg-chelatase subunit ChlD